ncbi:HAD-IA family hydrolase [uncultured Ferrimonas sp.]|uniref:HAD family hydrolase n=1 Tax=uncultured Ferrimonas sp. TaxID=432640 RepID=UPI00260A85A6|nr:HAD-IA family hydrolase [uncultured Ferrimonas sp.]
MRFNRRLQPFAAISFDLDDTLYDNKPVLIHAETLLLRHLSSLGNVSQLGDPFWWMQQKQQLLQQQPQLAQCTTASRLATLKQGLAALQLSNSEQLATDAMAKFLHWRSDIHIAPAVIELLQDLAAQYPLAVITNGNANVRQFLPQIPFATVLAAGQDGPMKPDPTLFQRCCKQLNIAPAQLLHIGDHPDSDIAGAINAGCQAVWLSPQYGGTPRPAGSVLPTATISSLEALRQLL